MFFLNKKIKWSPHSNSSKFSWHSQWKSNVLNIGKKWLQNCESKSKFRKWKTKRKKKMPFKTTNFYQIGNSRCLVVLVVNFYREKWILYKKKSAQKWHTLQVVECYTPDSQLIWLRHSIKVTYTSAIFWDCLSY